MSKLEDLKVGMMVAYYDSGHRYVGIINDICGGSIYIKEGDFNTVVHPKQVRRLIKKKHEFYWVRKCYSFTFNGTLPITANHDYVSTCTVDPICGSCKVFRVKRVKE